VFRHTQPDEHAVILGARHARAIVHPVRKQQHTRCYLNTRENLDPRARAELDTYDSHVQGAAC
jgi:hypothetical protein